MNQEEFKKQIEHPIDKLGIANVNNAKEAELVFWRRIELFSTIARTWLFRCILHSGNPYNYNCYVL